MSTNLRTKYGNDRIKDETLITEFTVSGSMDNLMDLVKEVVRENHFALKPMRYYHKRGKQQSYQVLKEDLTTKEIFCCGAIEVIQRKENKVVVKFDSTRCSINEPHHANNKETLERFFVAIVQRLMQQGIVKTNKG